MSTPPAGRATAADTADRATSDPAPLVPTATAADPPAAGPDPCPERVTAQEITEFLRHLTEIRGPRGDDPGERAAFLARKAELLTRIRADLPAPPATGGRTP